MANELVPDSPCSARVTPGDRGGITVSVFIPTYDGGLSLRIGAARDADGDWVVDVPWPDIDVMREVGLEQVCLPDGHQVTNGLLHLGAPDVPVLRRAD